MRNWIVFAALMIGGATLSADTQPVVVDMKTCHSLNNPKKPFILVLHRGEPILASIRQCIEVANIPSASISAIGAIEDPVVSDYKLNRHEYIDKKFPGIHELVSLNGTTSYNEQGQTVAHIHIVFTDGNYRALGGHLTDGKVGVVVEVTITPLDKPILRAYNEEIGLELMQPTK